MKSFLNVWAITLAVTLSGCATEKFTTRATPTLACDKVFVASMWGFFGITTSLDPLDSAELLKKCRAAQTP